MDLVKCIVPGCKIVGEGNPRRPYACDKHASMILSTVRGARGVASAFLKRKGAAAPWWFKAFIAGVQDGG